MYFMDTFMKVMAIVLAIFIVGLAVYGLVTMEDTRVECLVVSCEEADPYVNHAAKTMATINFINGKYTSSMMYNTMAQPQARYITVVEYEGVQYELETSSKYEVGEVVQLPNPAKN